MAALQLPAESHDITINGTQILQMTICMYSKWGINCHLGTESDSLGLQLYDSIKFDATF